MSRGKKFEEDFQNSGNSIRGVLVERIPDPVGGYKSVANFADFYVYEYPHLYYFELKSRRGKYFQIGGKNPDYTEKQYNGLLEKSNIHGVHAGFLVEFQDYEQHFYFPIEVINFYKDTLTSIKAPEAHNYGIRVNTTKKRTRYHIDIEKLLNDVEGWDQWTLMREE